MTSQLQPKLFSASELRSLVSATQPSVFKHPKVATQAPKDLLIHAQSSPPPVTLAPLPHLVPLLYVLTTMSSDDESTSTVGKGVDKGKGRAQTADPSERTPLLASQSNTSDDDVQLETTSNSRRRLWYRLTVVFLVLLSLCMCMCSSHFE